MTNHHISVPKADLILAMDDLRLSGRDYSADLLGKALFSASVSAQPASISLEVCTLGNYGAAYDLPGKRRAYTYEHQPGNIKASRLGSACLEAAAASAGDTIDRGLGLLKELQAQGFGVFDVEASRWHAAPVAAQPDVTQQTLDDVMAGIPARDAEIEALRKEIETLRAQQDTDKANALPPMNDDLIAILGRPNFICAQLADTLRSGGRDIAKRAENEQAAVIHFLLGHYLADPIQWAEKASTALKTARKEPDR
ncbi:hypothetical protein JT27_15650 [Alcaligenes faecalis]|uniref:hypothetical protein n=1 Tax=Alcaligenes faecalis TaxID=511 RepID=UPI00052D8C5A|nr:hypothetical protein [Alcaligenes faecalis]KGP00553.1 hypothetical protein JT27_15650 [Alcaligenes faecalis]